jgi:hypothetical protein
MDCQPVGTLITFVLIGPLHVIGELCRLFIRP